MLVSKEVKDSSFLTKKEMKRKRFLLKKNKLNLAETRKLKILNLRTFLYPHTDLLIQKL